MNWNHVQLVFVREVRDQLRDRRTMFTICVLPLLLYPFMGMLMMQLAQFHRQQHVTIAVAGLENWPVALPLIENDADAESDTIRWKKIDPIATVKLRESLHQGPSTSPHSSQNPRVASEQVLQEIQADALLIVPESFAHFLQNSHSDPCLSSDVNRLCLVNNLRWERSQLATKLLMEHMDVWKDGWIRHRLSESQIDSRLLDQPRVYQLDVANPELKRTLVWSKILPFVMLIWALTGAFYPAIDLCAGEKERGTLETLLSGPAGRREIVWGKLLTVTSFSIFTALLNLGSMHITAAIVIRQFSNLGASEMASALGPLPLRSMIWLLLLVIPISAMFSALALAVACIARSTKEGQYYLMPLLFFGMPLVMIPMIPGVVLAPGTSVIPVTGAVLLVRALMDGQYQHALSHLPVVVVTTLLCCMLSIRWAVKQFESETLLFRSGDRFALSQWLRDVWSQREDQPTVGESILAGMLILVALFFGRLSLSGMDFTWQGIVQSTLIIQIGMILAPVLIMATILTRSVRHSLRIHPFAWTDTLAAVALAISLHPVYAAFASIVGNEYKLGKQTTDMLQQFDSLIGGTPFWQVLFFLAIVPAVCEELAFRGFIFAGLLRREGYVRAILLSSLFFGLSHGVLQQTITASTMGLLLGWLAYRTGGVACTIAFHITHNALSMWLATLSHRPGSLPAWFDFFLTTDSGSFGYTTEWMTIGGLMAVLIVAWLFRRELPTYRFPIAAPAQPA